MLRECCVLWLLSWLAWSGASLKVTYSDLSQARRVLGVGSPT